MGGVDTHDYMRMGSYSLQKTYKTNYWPKTIFLALLDIALVNMYIIWKLVHYGTPHMKTREDFYTSLAEEMFFYTGFDPIVRTRSLAKAVPSPSPVNRSKSPRGNGERDLRAREYSGHEFTKYLSKPKKTRLSVKLVKKEEYKYGYGGRDSKYRYCFVCARLAAGRHQTNLYCSCCRVPVCATNMLRKDKEGEPYLCWNELHDNVAMQRAVLKPSED